MLFQFWGKCTGTNTYPILIKTHFAPLDLLMFGLILSDLPFDQEATTQVRFIITYRYLVRIRYLLSGTWQSIRNQLFPVFFGGIFTNLFAIPIPSFQLNRSMYTGYLLFR